jgi:hypothetical protein
MEPFLKSWLDTQRSNDFAAFRGASISGAIPIPQEVINEIMREAVPRDRGMDCSFELAPDGVIFASFKPPVLPLQRLEFHIVEGTARFSGKPVWRLQLVVGGWLARLGLQNVLSLLMSFLMSLFPQRREVLRLSGAVLEVDVRELVAAVGLGDNSGWFRELSISTVSRKLVLTFQLSIE